MAKLEMWAANPDDNYGSCTHPSFFIGILPYAITFNPEGGRLLPIILERRAIAL
jgi:hypothetical protein